MKGREALRTVTKHKSFFIFLSHFQYNQDQDLYKGCEAWCIETSCLNIGFANWLPGIPLTEAELLSPVLWALFPSSIIYFLPSLQLFSTCQGRCSFRDEIVVSASKAVLSFCLFSLTVIPSLLLEMVWLMKPVVWMTTQAFSCHNGKFSVTQ